MQCQAHWRLILFSTGLLSHQLIIFHDGQSAHDPIQRRPHSENPIQRLNRNPNRKTFYGLSKNWIFRFHPRWVCVCMFATVLVARTRLYGVLVCVSVNVWEFLLFYHFIIGEASNAHTQKFIVYARQECASCTIHYSVSIWYRMEATVAATVAPVTAVAKHWERERG